METRANYVIVGAFVLVLLVGAAGVLLWLIGSQFQTSVAYYEISFAGSVAGLDRDSTVRYKGVPVGKVAEIDIDQINPNHIRVVIALDPVTIIRSDAVATLAMQGLTGGSYIEISGGTVNAPPLPHRDRPPYPFIQSESSGLQSLFDKAPEVLTRLIDIEDQLKKILNEQNQAALAETIENVRRLTGTLASHDKDIDDILANASSLTHNFDELGKTATTTVQNLDGKVDATLNRVNTALGHVDVLVGHTDKLVGNVDSTVQENRPGLRDFSSRGLSGVEQLITNTNDLVLKLGRIADELERDPARFLFGDKNKGYQPK